MQGNPPALPRDLLAWLQSMRPALVGARTDRPSQTPGPESARSVTDRSFTMRQYPLRRRIRLCHICLCSSLSASGVRNCAQHAEAVHYHSQTREIPAKRQTLSEANIGFSCPCKTPLLKIQAAKDARPARPASFGAQRTGMCLLAIQNRRQLVTAPRCSSLPVTYSYARAPRLLAENQGREQRGICCGGPRRVSHRMRPVQQPVQDAELPRELCDLRSALANVHLFVHARLRPHGPFHRRACSSAGVHIYHMHACAPTRLPNS